MSGFSVILVPTDLGEPARNALGLARALARPGARLIVAHVSSASEGSPTDDVEKPDLSLSLSAWLDDFDRLDPSLPLRVERVVRSGPPAETIVALADELRCELIVIGTHGRDGVERLLMGSVAQEVLRRAACPVLCLPATTPGPYATASPTDLGAFLRVD